ncbi:hypothetical protein TELCIR_12489 [Teladorsagia circumcincta]|uniref:PABS domain-containing protein n=1 Tax=Teladorsagia circumcincta TaxID=45464 RepID=A0A2G9U6C3_TELCI|nr:hypothetical protein TELCIR_12489 [Teladorsagia circumcincta]
MAKKWFSLETDKLFQVIIGDGVEYLRQSVRKGRRFDAIVLDACFIEAHDDIHCPSSVFLNTEAIQDMAKLIGDQGVLIVNVVPNSNYPANVVGKVKALFLKSFKYFKETHVEGTSNYVLTFTQFKHKELYAELSKIAGS